jgi:threonine/homoserine/homoserine lactone efflux protein
LGLGMAVHATYSLIGIGLIIAQSIVLFSILKFIGAAYLIYFGYKCLCAKAADAQNFSTRKTQDLSALAAIRIGFLTNILNPKATLFFLALFTQVVSPQTPKFIQVIYAVEMSLMTFLWFAFVCVILSYKRVKVKFFLVQHWFERFFGALLIALGIKVAFLQR